MKRTLTVFVAGLLFSFFLALATGTFLNMTPFDLGRTIYVDPLPNYAYAARISKTTLPRVEVLNNGKTLHFQTLQPTEKDFENIVTLFPLFSAAQDMGHGLRPTTPDENFVLFQIMSERATKDYCLNDYESDLSTDPSFATRHPAVIEMCKKYKSHPR